MRPPETSAQTRAAAEKPPAGSSGPSLPPGQYVPGGWPVLHYGPVPVFQPDAWNLRVHGATASGREHRWSWAGLGALPRCQVLADFHCVTKFTVRDIAWEGIAAAEVLRAAPPDGAVLSPEHGHPLRLVVPSRYAWKSVKWVRAVEYLTVDRRGFWEERGYHNNADPWREQRYSYQELPGDGPDL